MRDLEVSGNLKNSMNYIEIRSLDDVDKKNIDKVLHKISIPMRLTNETQPMQGVTFDEKNTCIGIQETVIQIIETI